jgi:hypothetical protein
MYKQIHPWQWKNILIFLHTEFKKYILIFMQNLLITPSAAWVTEQTEQGGIMELTPI